jgi:DNA-binding transcriptional regulator YiaG
VDEIHCGGELHQRLPNVDGRGVILGIVDRGCDFSHPNFRNQDGATRLLSLWDQTRDHTEGPGSLSAPVPFGYGREFTPEALRPDAVKTPALALQATDYAVAPEAHGTRVLDIAAGNGGHNGIGTGFPGVAPGADLVFVELAATGHLISSRKLLEAVVYIFQKAKDEGRPVVVNLSLESYAGPHDGSSLVEEAFDLLLEEEPGRAIVIAAGNSREKKIHAHREDLEVGGNAELAWTLALNQGADDECEIWYPGSGRLEVFLKPPGATEELGPFSPGSRQKILESEVCRGYVFHELDDPNNHDHQILLRLPPVPANGGTWTVRLHNSGEGPVTFHAWIERDDAGQSFFENATEKLTLNALACGHHTLAVGAYDARLEKKEPASFSSLGPTRDGEGRPKPDLYAPGVGVSTASAHSVHKRINQGDGTSLAAPHVSGMVALLLQAGGRSAPVLDLLMSAARAENPTHGVDGLAALTGLPSAAMVLPALAASPETSGAEGIAEEVSAVARFAARTLTTGIPNLTDEPSARAIPASVRQRLLLGRFESGEDIKALRRFAGLTQEQLASAMGVSVRTLRNWEQGRRQPEGPALALLRIVARYPGILREDMESVESAA